MASASVAAAGMAHSGALATTADAIAAAGEMLTTAGNMAAYMAVVEAKENFYAG